MTSWQPFLFFQVQVYDPWMKFPVQFEDKEPLACPGSRESELQASDPHPAGQGAVLLTSGELLVVPAVKYKKVEVSPVKFPETADHRLTGLQGEMPLHEIAGLLEDLHLPHG